MILLIDNYDSFSYNLYQLVGSLDPDIKTVRNDKIEIDQIESLNPNAILLSPGPGRPEDAGVCVEVVRRFAGRIPILGVCLGHQVIGVAMGGKVDLADVPFHGKRATISIDQNSPLFAGLPEKIDAARYHSLLILKDETFPKELSIIAESEKGEIMAVAHREYPLFGLQFHPESIMTPTGPVILKNFLQIVHSFHPQRERRVS